MSQASGRLGRRAARLLILALLLVYSVGTVFASLPVVFEENDGQASPEVAFLARTSGYRLFLTRRGAVVALDDGHTVGIQFAHSPGTAPAGTHRLLGKTNYLVGSDPERWRTGIANYEGVTYTDVYPGIDLIWHAQGQQIEHDFRVGSGADPRKIRLTFSGTRLRLTREGDVMAGTLRFQKPRAYQDSREVECSYEMHGTSVHFALGRYDHSHPLTIDPILSFSSYLGGSQADSAAGIALDSADNMYVAGTTASADFPATAGALQPNATGDRCPVFSKVPGASVPCTDIFVTKLSSDGSTMLFSTYLGGPSDDSAVAITADSSGHAYLLGGTTGGFPKLAPLSGQAPPIDRESLFVAKLSADGSSLIYATWLPVNATAIAVDAAGALYLTGTSEGGLPVVNAFQNASADAFLFKTPDAGNHWQRITDGLPNDAPSLLAADPSNPQVLYLGLWGPGVFKSTDAGGHWTAINNGVAPGVPMALVVDPRAPQTLYMETLGTSSQVYKSSDGGGSWNVSNNGISGIIRALAIDANNSNVYAVTTNGLFKSTDGASTWSLTGLTADPFKVFLDPSQAGTIYVGTANGIMKSIDGGATWAVMSNGLPSNARTLSLAIDPVNPQTLYTGLAGTSTIFKSADGGAHWTQLYAPFEATSLLVDPLVHTRVWAGGPGGVLVSSDSGATWTQTASPFPPLSIVGLTADGAGDLYVAGCCSGGDAFAMKLDPTGSQIVYSTYLGGIGQDRGTAIAVDGSGRAYIAGQTDSPDFPVLSAVQPRIGGSADAFVTVLDPTGARLAWSTYFGGSGLESPPFLAVDAGANAHLAGIVGNSGGTVGLGNAYAAKIKSDGSAVLYSTQLGATVVAGVAADGAGNSYIVGTAGAGLSTLNAIQPAFGGIADAFVTALDGKTGAVQYATYLGGSGGDSAKGIAADSGGSVYLAGTTNSPDFPLKYSSRTFGSCALSVNGCLYGHVFVAKLAAPGNGPALRLDAVTNAASYGATLAPGELVTVWGGDLAVTPATAGQIPLPKQLSDVHVAVNGVAAPLIYASDSQINAQIPFETPIGSAQVQVTSGAGAGTKSVTIAAVAPAIFSLNASGAGAGAIQHGDTYQVVNEANPATAGEIISIYCTGLGAVNPPAQTGAGPSGPSSTVVSVQVSIGGLMAPVLYNGVAPGFPGLYQVNAQVPAGTPSGAQSLQVLQNGVASNTVTIAVR